MIREIIQLGNPILRKIAAQVSFPLSEDAKSIANDLLETQKASGGVGLAAPQIGESVSMIVISSRPRPQNPEATLIEPYLLINPEIKFASKEKEKGWEGCLSFSSLRGYVLRHCALSVTYQDIHGVVHQDKLQGFIARVFQHEFDHLQGVVYLDRLESMHELMTDKEYENRIVGSNQ